MHRMFAAAAMLCVLSPAVARDDGRYANADPAIREWYRTRELTPEAQKRFGFKSCCDHSDRIKTQFRVNRRDGGDEWYWLDSGRWSRVPPDIIHWNSPPPGGEAVLFAIGGRPTCFFPPLGGI